MESKVLIIDDDERLQRLLREYLEGYGFRVVSLYEGSGAVEMLEKTTPNIVILDIMLPDADGLEILREQLMTAARGRDLAAFERSVDMHISRLRSKLESINDSQARIRTAWGSGYMFLSSL